MTWLTMDPTTWPPVSTTARQKVVHRAVRMATVMFDGVGLSPSYIGGMMSSARQVCLRGGFDPMMMTEWKDAKDRFLRLQAGWCVRQAVAATRSDVQRLFDWDPRGYGMLVAILFYAVARLSDWSRPDLLGGPGVLRKDVTWVDPLWQAKYAATKTDPTGVSRTVMFGLPRVMQAEFKRLLRVTPPEKPLFRETSASLRAFLDAAKKAGVVWRHLTAHSPRRGGVYAALSAGARGRAVMKLTGHQSLEVLCRYAGVTPLEWQRHFKEVAGRLVR